MRPIFPSTACCLAVLSLLALTDALYLANTLGLTPVGGILGLQGPEAVLWATDLLSVLYVMTLQQAVLSSPWAGQSEGTPPV